MTEIGVNFENMCRLCGSDGGIHINIFELPPGYLSKIEALIPSVVILRHDIFPKTLCHRCTAKINEYHEFRDLCVRTQERFKKLLPWMPSTKTTQTQAGNASPMVLFMGGSPAYPFGDREAEVEVLILSDDENDTKPTTGDQGSENTVSKGYPGPGPAKRKRSTEQVPTQQAELPENKRSQQQGPNIELSHPNLQTNILSTSGKPPKGVQPLKIAERVLQASVVPVRIAPSSAASVSASGTTHSRTFIMQPRPQVSVPSQATPPTSQQVKGHAVLTSVPQPTKPTQPKPMYSLVAPPGIVIPQRIIAPKGNSVKVNLSDQGRCALPVSLASSQPSGKEQPLYISTRIPSIKSNTNDKSPIKLKISAIRSAGETSCATQDSVKLKNGTILPIVNLNQNHNQERRKPKPKCKQKWDIEEQHLKSQEEQNTQNPKAFHAIRISEKDSVFTCCKCNIIYVSADAVQKHVCSPAPSRILQASNNNGVVISDSQGNVATVNNNSNDPIQCIPIGDDDDSVSLPDPVFNCVKCSKVFHSSSRLDKHQAVCQGIV